MIERLKQPAFILGILGALKLALNSIGIDIPDETINQLANGISSVLVVIGIFMNHSK
ncbi:MAG: hypothetical protein K0S39_155 [Paenibacillus sp.]|jgi:uncharacterized membrane protein|nr:hypothetical protein [Paenibacillus sp.]